jgi:ferredoxin-NADP reductase
VAAALGDCPDLPGHDVYLAGPDAFVQRVQADLLRAGAADDRIRVEPVSLAHPPRSGAG